jgi:hypothetical protein
MKFNENPPPPRLGVEVCMRIDRQTDRHDKANGRFSQFCETRLKTGQIKCVVVFD